MASRILWVMGAGAAIVTGMLVQDGDQMFGWGHDKEVSTRIDRRVDRAVDRSVARIKITDSDGRELDVPQNRERAMADAIGRLVKAQADLTLLRIRDGNSQEQAVARTRRDQARAEVETLKEAIKKHDQAREQGRHEVRDEVRQAFRDAVRS